MPIPVVCGNCQTRLNAPDAAAGKKVKCPKCQTVMPVPGETADDAPPPPPPASDKSFDFGAAISSGSEPKPRGDRPRRDDDRPRRRDEDDDRPRTRRPRDEEPDDRPRRPRPRDDDEDDDRPRRRPDKKSSMGPLLLIGGGFLLLTCCGGGGFGLYYSVGKVREAAERQRAENDAKEKQIQDELKRRAGEPGGAAAGAGGVPAGWTKFEAPDKSFRAAFPPPGPDEDDLSLRTPAVEGAKSYLIRDGNSGATYRLTVVKFKATSTAADRERDMKTAVGMVNFNAKNVGAPRTVDWLGGKATETEGENSIFPGFVVVARWVVVENTGYMALVNHNRSRPAEVAPFFNSVEARSK